MKDKQVATFRDPQTCRRALREIGGIAALAVLPDSQMTDQEALQNIGAIAEWVREEAPGAQPDCGSIIQRLHELMSDLAVEALDDQAALDLFAEVLGALESAGPDVFSEFHATAVGA